MACSEALLGTIVWVISCGKAFGMMCVLYEAGALADQSGGACTLAIHVLAWSVRAVRSMLQALGRCT
jgi:hypothetical protein